MESQALLRRLRTIKLRTWQETSSYLKHLRLGQAAAPQTVGEGTHDVRACLLHKQTEVNGTQGDPSQAHNCSGYVTSALLVVALAWCLSLDHILE